MWEKFLLLVVASVITLFAGTIAWFVLTVGAREATPLSQGPVTLGTEWKTLTPPHVLECSRSLKSIELVFPRGLDAQLAEISEVERAAPEVVLIDSRGRSYPLASNGTASSGQSFALVYRSADLPGNFALRAVKIRAAIEVSVSDVRWDCSNYGL